MIGALVRGCTDVTGVARLFSELGYRVEVRQVRHEALRLLGVTGTLPVVHHLARQGGVDLYVACPESDDEAAATGELQKALAARNHVIKPVFVELRNGGAASFSIRAAVGALPRRLDVDTSNPSSDAVDRICGLMLRGRQDGFCDPGALFDRALDREAVGRKFFERFKSAVSLISRQVSEAAAAEADIECRSYALLLLSRILFLYLLQRKGWLDGDHRFLRDRLQAADRESGNFHSSVLTPLFFDCLNTPHVRRPAGALRLGQVPYLNGGLFEPSSFELRNRDVELSNEAWKNVLDSTFEPFSLSVTEDDAEGTHVDPEMLGHVFERLMESEERARTGSFYTPREVVDRLTRSAIIRWCGADDDSVSRALFAIGRGEAPKIDREVALRTLKRLSRITVLDPACGSGAFLLSALRLIETLTIALLKIVGRRVPKDLRARIASSSLFGVDLKMEAVRLCELRIWLAIVSASQHQVNEVPPLPNLDRNILQGNSLVGPLDFLAEGRREIYRDWSNGLRERGHLTAAYRRSSSNDRRKIIARLRKSDEELAKALLGRSLGKDREELRTLTEDAPPLFEGAPELHKRQRQRLAARIDSTARLIRRVGQREVDFFSFDIFFADVLRRRGFHVVVGNPPWVRGSRVEPGLRKLLADRYESFSSGNGPGFRQAELSMAFVEKSIELCAPGGVVAQLVPSKLLSADYARAVRAKLLGKTSVCELIDWSTSGKKMFGADVYPLGIVAKKGEGRSLVDVQNGDQRFDVAPNDLSVNGLCSPWSIAPPDIREILERIRARFRPLEEVLGRRPCMGVKTGANRLFFLDDVEVGAEGIHLPAIGVDLPFHAVVRTVRGRDLRRWSAVDSTWMLWPPGLDGQPRLKACLARHLGIEPGALRLGYVKSEHLGLKAAWKDVSKGLNAALLPETTIVGGVQFSVVPNQTLYSIDVTSKNEGLVICGVLNSTVANALALETAERAKDHHWRFLASVVGEVPVPDLTRRSVVVDALARQARRATTGRDCDEEIDRLVAQMYEVKPAELRRLRRFVDDRLGRTRA